MKPPLLEAIKQRPLLGDGAMGTQLMFAGLVQGNCGEEWNVEHPEKVLAIQRRYVEAGSDCLITNTFGGCRIMLNRHGNADKVAEYRSGKDKLFGFFVGQVMKSTGGKANPKLLNDLLKQKLS